MVRWLEIDRIRGHIKAFLHDQRGSVLTIMGFGLVMAAGFTALAVDMSYLYALKGRLQTTADFAALAAVTQLPDDDAAEDTALEYAAKNMPASEHGGVLANADVVAGNWDGSSRTFTPAGDPINAIRVVTRRSQANGNAAGLFFARVLGFNQVDVETTAIASTASGGACVIALEPSADDALRVSGGAVVTLGCGAVVNSTGNKAIRVAGGGACLTATSITTMGDTQGSCINSETAIETAAPDPVADPMDYLDDADNDDCDFVTVVEVTVDTVLDPGVYCGGIDINGGPIVDFNPGNYIIKGDGLSITGNPIVTGDEVMFYFSPDITGIPDTNPATTVHLAGTADITLSAPTSGDYKDVLFYQDGNTPDNFINKFNGGADLELNGVLYFPNNIVHFSGNGDPGGATSIIGRMVKFSGNANLGTNPDTRTFGPNGVNGISLVQ